MRTLPRFISIASMVTLGLGAVPLLASAAPLLQTTQSEESTASPMHGAGKLIDKALDEVQLRPDQKTAVEALKAEAEKRHAPVKAAKDRLATELADQVERGKLDRCAVADEIKALASAVADAHPGDRAGFEKLHSILDPGQRAVFVDALKRQWDSVEKMHEPSALADKITKELNLSADQRTSVEKILTGLREVREAEPSYAAHHERWTKILDAFKSDHFVLDQVAPEGDVAAHTAAKVERMLWAKEALLPVFTPEQRKVVADKIRDWVKGTAPQSRSVSPGMSPSEGE
jgi:Spy/CpxP family protein refolding chaperone